MDNKQLNIRNNIDNHLDLKLSVREDNKKLHLKPKNMNRQQKINNKLMRGYPEKEYYYF